MKCTICSASVPSQEAAIDAGWEPDFHLHHPKGGEIGDDGFIYFSSPLCLECSTKYIDWDDYKQGGGDRALRRDIPDDVRRMLLALNAQRD